MGVPLGQYFAFLFFFSFCLFLSFYPVIRGEILKYVSPDIISRGYDFNYLYDHWRRKKGGGGAGGPGHP